MRRLLPFLLLPLIAIPAAADPLADALARPALPVGAAVPIVLEERQVLLFRLPDAASPLLVETQNLTDGTDPVLHLVDGRGRVLATDDDGGGEPLAARLAVLPRPGAARLVQVRTLHGAPGAFDLVVSPRPAAPEGTHWTLSEAAQTAPAALPLRLTLDAGARVVLRLPDDRRDAVAAARSLDGRADPVLTLLDPNGEAIEEDDDGLGGTDAGVEVPAALAGPHYLRLTMLSGGTVSLALEDPVPEAPLAMGPASPEAARSAPALAPEAPLRLRLGQGQSAFFRLPEGAWTAQTRNLARATDTVLRLRAPDGRILGEDDDGGGNLASRLAVPNRRPAGALLEATTFDGAGGTFDLVLTPAR